MSAEPVTVDRVDVRLRVDLPDLELMPRRAAVVAVTVALAVAFVLVGGGSLDPGPIEARVGLAAGERIGPFGLVFGGWDPSLWPAQVAPAALWAQWEYGSPTAASLRWPAAIAGVVLGLILARRSREALGARAGVLTALCWFGSVALIDRSAGAGIDLVAGLATVAALDRLVGRGSDLVAGLWAALAFLSAGWPPVALIALTTVVLGRRGASLNARLLGPPLVAAVSWTAWTLSVAPAEAWGAALAYPLTQKPSWTLALGVVALGLPWSPLAALAISRAIREGWTEPGRALVVGWLQVSGASLLAGTVIPGLATAARLPALAGLAVATASCGDRLWSRSVPAGARRASLAMTAAVVAGWVAIVLAGGTWLAVAVAYYRGLAILLLALALPTAWLAVSAVARSDSRRAVVTLAMVAACLKLAHWGYYVPEWNYRRSQGPWGRAIGQWVPPHWTIHTVHAWPTDLAFAARRPFRQLASPQHLGFLDRSRPLFVLLLDSEFEHWPKEAPALTRVAAFQDERGRGRVLARTEGHFPWDRAGRDRSDD
jgi:hypothetical protein